MPAIARQLAAACAVCAALTAVAFPAAAQEDDAFAHFDRGAELYFQGDYSKAIVEFKRGYEIEPHPMFQINIALAYWRLDNLDEAINHGEEARAGADKLEDDVRTENQARLHVWRTTAKTRALAEAAHRRAEALARQEQTVEASDTTTTEPEPEPLFGPVGWAGVGTAGAGVVSLGVWSVLELSLDDDVVAFREAGRAGDADRFDALRAELERKQRVARGVLFAGIGLSAVGGALIAYDLLAGAGTEVTVGLDPTRGRVVLHGSF